MVCIFGIRESWRLWVINFEVPGIKMGVQGDHYTNRKNNLQSMCMLIIDGLIQNIGTEWRLSDMDCPNKCISYQKRNICWYIMYMLQLFQHPFFFGIHWDAQWTWFVSILKMYTYKMQYFVSGKTLGYWDRFKKLHSQVVPLDSMGTYACIMQDYQKMIQYKQ